MAKNPMEQVLHNLEFFSRCVHTHMSNFFQNLQKNEPNSTKRGSSSVTLGNNKIGDAWQFDQGATKRGSFLEGEKKIPFHLDRADYRGDFDGTDAVAVDNTKSLTQGKPGKLISKEELGRATWTLLHTIGAQFPDKPTKQQKRDVKELMAILSRIYPCKECADHFKDVLKANPVEANSGAELAQWMCRVHNVVNRSLDKPSFPCQRVDARWGALECDEGACDLQGQRKSRV
ncbi:FAD-linked sulfhydryl oxidase ERV1 isoform X2 [Cryptomeria japonica]|uniref:FAD-linked sulfhydryl oxidase ERV1 isoform X2 n=1 Tax=Cryptomeria japonica TaxID=3369 RepID=UPI0025AC32BE|nr:FAD-linked sulfhydryl oxidase ERV1 isoform X2 [Cryptomeria japonica]